MGRIDEEADPFRREPAREARGAAEAAAADRAAGKRRGAGAAGEGIGEAEAGSGGEPRREQASLAGAAEDEDVHAAF